MAVETTGYMETAKQPAPYDWKFCLYCGDELEAKGLYECTACGEQLNPIPRYTGNVIWKTEWSG